MSVLITADIKGQTPQGYDGMLATLGPLLRRAPGVVCHASHPTEDGWRVIEVWDSAAQANAFYAEFVAPRLPAGIRPKRSVVELHSFVTPA